jgi:ATP-binding cassette subfamily B protein
MARATNDLNAVRMLLGPAIMYSANTIVLPPGPRFHASISPNDALCLPAPSRGSIVVQYFGKLIHERFEKIQAMFSEISARAQENFSGPARYQGLRAGRAGDRCFQTSIGNTLTAASSWSG